MGGAMTLGAKAAEVAPAHVIGENEKEVRPLLGAFADGHERSFVRGGRLTTIPQTGNVFHGNSLSAAKATDPVAPGPNGIRVSSKA